VNGCLLSVSVSPGITPHPSERSPAPMNMSELKYLGGGEGWGRGDAGEKRRRVGREWVERRAKGAGQRHAEKVFQRRFSETGEGTQSTSTGP
jgi:hypothetical protein